MLDAQPKKEDNKQNFALLKKQLVANIEKALAAEEIYPCTRMLWKNLQ